MPVSANDVGEELLHVLRNVCARHIRANAAVSITAVSGLNLDPGDELLHVPRNPSLLVHGNDQ